MPPDSTSYNEIAGAIADGVPVDWDLIGQTGSLSERETAAFRTLEAMRRIQCAPLDEMNLASAQDDLHVETGFQILEELGRGAHSKVFRAVDRALDREVALKVLKNTVLPSVRERKRFLREARTLASLDHPNIVRMLSIDQTEGALRLCIEKIDGRTLADHISDEGTFDLDETVRIGIDLCRALKTLHAKGLVHRDLKPTNVMLTTEGRVVLLDFGLAHSIGPADLKTARGMTGTPLVMAPEQFSPGGAMEPSVDIYALGVLLYWMVSGRFPYEAKSYDALRRRVLDGDAVGLKERCPDAPALFVAIVEKAIASRPAERFASAHAFEHALLRYERRAGAVGGKKIVPWAIALTVLLTAGIGAISTFFGAAAEGGAITIQAATGEKIILSARTEAGGEFDIFSVDPDGTGRVNLTADYPYDAIHPRLSPDGTRIVFIKRERDARTLCGMFADGSAKREIVNYERGFGPGCPEWIDSRRLVYLSGPRTGKNSLRSVDFSGERNDLLLEVPSMDDPSPNMIGLSPDGTKMAICSQEGSFSPSLDIYLAEIGSDGGVTGVETFYADEANDTADRDPLWSPDSQTVYWSHLVPNPAGGWTNVIVQKDLTLERSAHEYDGVIRQSGAEEVHLLSISPDGERLLCFSGNRLFAIHVASGAERQIPFSAEALSGADWGEVRLEKIFFAARQKAQSESDIYSINPDGTREANLTGDFTGDALGPVLSPDGRFVAFLQRKSDLNHIWVMACDGSLRSLLTSVTADYRILGWLDDETVVYSRESQDATSLDIWVIDRKGNACFWFEAGGPGQPEILEIARTATGGRYAAVTGPVSGEEENYHVGLLDPDSGRVTPLAADRPEGGARSLLWSADGQTLFWARSGGAADENEEVALHFSSIDSADESSQRGVLRRPGEEDRARPFAASPAGDSILLCCRPHESAMELVLHDLQKDASAERSLVFQKWEIGAADWGLVVGAE